MRFFDESGTCILFVVIFIQYFGILQRPRQRCDEGRFLNRVSCRWLQHIATYFEKYVVIAERIREKFDFWCNNYFRSKMAARNFHGLVITVLYRKLDFLIIQEFLTETIEPPISSDLSTLCYIIFVVEITSGVKMSAGNFYCLVITVLYRKLYNYLNISGSLFWKFEVGPNFPTAFRSIF